MGGMNNGLKLQVFLAVAPAILLACAGLWLLTHVVRDVKVNRQAFEDMRGEQWKALLHDVEGPCEWRGGARHCSRAMVGESGLETC